MLLAIGTLWKREVVRFLRQRGRVIGALATPIMFWFLMGSGFGKSLRPMTAGIEPSYLEYFFPGTLLLIILFTAIFSTISIIQDRTEGFMQSILVSPAPRIALVLGKSLGGMTLSLLQGVLFLMLAPLCGISLTFVSFVQAAGVLALTGFVMTALGYLVAWPSTSVQGFHAIMNLFLMPLWLLSGALFPADGAAIWIRWLMQVNPLYYGLVGLQRSLYSEGHPMVAGQPAMWQAMLILTLAGVVLTIAGTQLTRRFRVPLP